METVPSKFTVGSIGTPRRGEARRRQADRRGACAGATVDRRTTGGANLEEGRNARNGQYCRVFPQTIDVVRTRAEAMGIEVVVADLGAGLPDDLVAVSIEAAAMAKVPLAGTSWIPGQ